MELAAKVVGRGHVNRIEALNMRCDSNEVPDPISELETDGYWIGVGTFRGMASVLDESEALLAEESITTSGAVRMTVVRGRLLAIVAPESTAAAVWVTGDPSDVRTEGFGSEGLLRRRPKAVRVSAPTWTLEVSEVSTLVRTSGDNESGQIASLLSALV